MPQKRKTTSVREFSSISEFDGEYTIKFTLSEDELIALLCCVEQKVLDPQVERKDRAMFNKIKIRMKRVVSVIQKDKQREVTQF